MIIKQASNYFKRYLKVARLAYANKVKESITSQKPGSCYFWKIANSVLINGKSAIPPLFSSLEVLSSTSDKTKLFGKNFSKNLILDDSDISLPSFPPRTSLKLNKFHVPPKLVKVITNLDLSKVSGPGSITVMVLKKSMSELSHILAELFSMCLKESCFRDS